jgi:hypothetical protein
MDPDLIAAYRATDYRIDASPPVVARIGDASAPVDALLRAQGVTTAVFITAFNPVSRPTDAAENARAQARLLAVLNAGGHAFLPGLGIGRVGDWPPEPSVLALGVTRAEAEALGRAYRQNAVVWIEAGRAPELLLTAP